MTTYIKSSGQNIPLGFLSAPWTDVNNYPSLTSAIASMSGGTLLIANPTVLASNTIIPSNINIVVINPGSINLSGYNITINGPCDFPISQIFNGTGMVTFGAGVISEVFPEYWGAIGDGVTDCGSALTSAIATGVPVKLSDNSIYAYAASPNFGVNKLFIYGNIATFKHTGSGNAFIMDAGASSGTVSGLSILDLTVQGNANSTNGIFARGIIHSKFRIRVTGASTTGNALLCNFCVLNTWENLRATVNETLSPVPANGINLTRRGSGENTTTQTFINPILEGLTGTAIVLDYANYNTFVGGVCESNNKGYTTTSNSARNQILGTDFEANTANDLELSGNSDSFYGLNIQKIHIYSPATLNAFFGGQIFTAAIVDLGANYNGFYGTDLNNSITDNSLYTAYVNALNSPGNASILPLNLQVNRNITIPGTTYNFLGNIPYGQMWYHNDSAPYTLALTTGTPAQIACFDTASDGQSLNGFSYSTSGLTCLIAGTYKVNYSQTMGSSTSNHIYRTRIAINGVEQLSTASHTKPSNSTDERASSGCGIMALNVNDVVTIQMTDTTAGNSTATIFSLNVNLERVGN